MNPSRIAKACSACVWSVAVWLAALPRAVLSFVSPYVRHALTVLFLHDADHAGTVLADPEAGAHTLGRHA